MSIMYTCECDKTYIMYTCDKTCIMYTCDKTPTSHINCNTLKCSRTYSDRYVTVFLPLHHQPPLSHLITLTPRMPPSPSTQHTPLLPLFFFPFLTTDPSHLNSL